MKNNRSIPISLPCTGAEEWQAVKSPIESGWLSQGPNVAEFEKAFADRHQVKYAFAATSCTTALHLILAALEVGRGDEVVVPAFTWVATANVVLYCGAKPVFVDVCRESYNLDPAQLHKCLSQKTKAIIPVHLFGLCAEMDSIREVAGSIPLIEDAACAAGAAYKETPAGSLGLAGAFSFHPRKPITTGEGGMVTTNDDKLADRIQMLRNHGASISEEQRHHGPRPYLLPEFNLLGFNYRMTDLQGAVGLVQLKKLDGFLEERNRWAQYYLDQLSDIDWLRLPKVPEYSRHSWQSFVTYVDPVSAPFSRNEIMEKLQTKGISTRPGTHAVHTLGYYRDRFDLKPEDYPGALDCDVNTMTIPLHNRMDEDDFHHIVDCIRKL